MSRPTLTKYYDPKSRDKGIHLFVYIEILKYLWDVCFYDFHVWTNFANDVKHLDFLLYQVPSVMCISPNI